MKVAVSACLLGVNCKYNGKNNRNERLLGLLRGHEVIPVCPEQLGGLPTPRAPAEIVNGMVFNTSGECVDREFRLGALRTLEMIRENEAVLVILQPRSPSCGVGRIYDGTFSGRIVPGMGVFAAMAVENGFRVRDTESMDEIERILNSQ